MTNTPKNDRSTRRPDCVTEIRIGNSVLVVSGYFKQDTTATAANAAAWGEGMRRLDEAVSARRSFAFETTLGGHSVAARLKAASSTHDVLMWVCGLASPELHIARVQARVAAGGHAIPETKIRERWTASIANLIALLPDLAEVRVFDNSASVAQGEPVPDPVPVAVIQRGRLIWPAGK
mgnify:CR=1 FL=1